MTAIDGAPPRARERTVAASIVRGLNRWPVHLTLLIIGLLWFLPTAALLVSSFRPPNEVLTTGWWTAFSLPFEFTLENYQDVLGQNRMAGSFINSLFITIPAVLIPIMIAAFAAFAFAWMDFPGRNLLLLVMVGLLVVPLQMTLIPVLRLYVALNVDVELPLLGGNVFGTSSYPGIWVAHAAYGLPFAIYLLRNFFGGLPKDLVEAAILDGASDLGVFFRIILPLSTPAIAALAIFQFLWTWNDLLVALVLLGDPNMAPMTLRITSLVSSFGGNYQLLTAAAFISMAVPLVLFFALQRYFVQGILSGAVKG